MRVSRLLAVAAYICVVPGSFAVAYLGFTAGYYPYIAVPVAFGVVLVATVAVLFVVLAKLRSREGDFAPRRS